MTPKLKKQIQRKKVRVYAILTKNGEVNVWGGNLLCVYSQHGPKNNPNFVEATLSYQTTKQK